MPVLWVTGLSQSAYEGILLSAHFTDEDTEAQEVMWPAQDMPAQGQGQDLNWNV